MDDSKTNPTTPSAPVDARATPPTPPISPVPPTPSETPPGSGGEPVSPKIQQHLDNTPHAKESLKAHHTKRFYTIILISAIIVLSLIAAVLGYFLLGNKISAKDYEASVAALPTIEPTPTSIPDPTAGWKEYTNQGLGFSIKLPVDYEVIRDTKQIASYGFKNQGSDKAEEYLIITSTNLTKYQSYKLCSESPDTFPCTSSTADTVLDGRPAKKIAYTAGPDLVYDLVQTAASPIIELRMLVAGGGLSNTFDQVLSTFTFIEAASSISAEGSPSAAPSN